MSHVQKRLRLCTGDYGIRLPTLSNELLYNVTLAVDNTYGVVPPTGSRPDHLPTGQYPQIVLVTNTQP
jgi:hypothetical protein